MSTTKYYPEKIWLLFFLLLAVCIFMLFIKSIPQDLNYHLFADNRTIEGIPNFWNVISNIPFFIIGISGIYYLINNKKYLKLKSLGLNYILFFVGIFFIAIGSANYHLNPNNTTIIWDRIPMTISFMSFFTIIIGEFIDQRKGALLLFPFIILGIGSVYYWHYTETLNNGDLRFYFLVQFFPMLLIPLIIILFKQKTQYTVFIWYVLLTYVFAKIAEVLDHSIFEYSHVLSGHTIKHFFAALAPLLFLCSIRENLSFCS